MSVCVLLARVTALVVRDAGLAGATGTFVAVGHRVAGVAQVGEPFTLEHLETTDRQRLGERHRVHRAFVGLASHFVFQGAHLEGAGGQHDHFRAVLAVAKDLARLRGLGAGGQQGGEGQCRE
nr:hypothetical protein GCM10020185_60420 [Pseudomonas brassicacearum subsp. brassicacearum]